MSNKTYSSSVSDFKNDLKSAKHLVVLTGAGISAESGIPTFRGAGGLWRTYNAQDLATPQAFNQNPSLVWEFYQYRREVVLSKKPNQGHYALVECEKRFKDEGKAFTLITQNIDGFHIDAGSKNVIEMHGNLFRTQCTKCKNVEERREPVLYSKKDGSIDELPSCKLCKGLLRPNVVWFNESLDSKIMKRIYEELGDCDFFIIVGTSGVVYPAASFASTVRSGGNIPIAEFNIEEPMQTDLLTYFFCGKSGELLPKCLLPEIQD